VLESIASYRENEQKEQANLFKRETQCFVFNVLTKLI